jgi:glycosyltransferase involved in cell wall biosynthesis
MAFRSECIDCMNKAIVTAASGARDAYQVPLALYEAGLLARHVTDFYSPDILADRPFYLPRTMANKLAKRHADGLPSRLVRSSRLLASRRLLRGLIPPLQRRWQGDQEPIGLTALRHARSHNAALLMYAGYAYSAFVAEERSARPRGLVQYHPHIRDSAHILRSDICRYPCLDDSLSQIERDSEDPTNLSELQIADKIVCCSTFTAKTCISLGINPAKITVVSYGAPSVGLRSGEARRRQVETCRFLFVGSGIHRKGLHHLLLAWRQANLSNSQLTIISRRIDPQIRINFDPGDNVLWLSSVSDSGLASMYESSDIFVMPSLIEGFGYVYLEAMAHGCFCIGTPNTALPDLLSHSSGAGCVVPAASPSLLADALREAEALALTGQLDRHAIANQASHFTWERFRGEIAAVGRDLVGSARIKP